MVRKSYGSVVIGVDGVIITVEVDVENGLPNFEIVGLPNGAVKEAKNRVRTSIKNSGINLGNKRITVNLAPADLRKEGSGLDLSIAVGLLAAYGIITSNELDTTLFAAELSLEGSLRGIPGVLPMVIEAKNAGFKQVFVAKENANEALLVEGIKVYTPDNLSQIISYFTGEREMFEAVRTANEDVENVFIQRDFADVQGQFTAKRALQIAAAGGHNVLMTGSPGTGKTMLAERLPTILPEMTFDEALEVTKIYSVAGMLFNQGLITKRPFSHPHHSASSAALIGGGTIPKPGSVTLSHNGVLFLDELPEFGKSLELLREPLEDKKITIARVNGTVTFPANFTLICAMNPCPCGWSGDPDHICRCTANEIRRYNRRISGPFLDRIDICVRVNRVKYEELSSTIPQENSATIREKVVKARQIQSERLKKFGIFCNAQIEHQYLHETCPMTNEAKKYLESIFKREKISVRSYDRIIKVARTLADIENVEVIELFHINEAVNFRSQSNLFN